MRGIETMKISLDYYEFKQAIEDYLLKEQGIQIDLENSVDYPYLETYESIPLADRKDNQPTSKRVVVSIDDLSEIAIFI